MKRMRKSRIQSKLFFTYSIIIITMLLIIVSFFDIWMSEQLRNRAFSDIRQTSVTMSQKLDDEISSMDTVSNNVCYSNLVKSRFANYASYKSDTNTINSIENSKELRDMLTAIIGPNRTVQQIYIYDFSGKAFGTGFDNREVTMPIQSKGVYQDILKKDGSKVVGIPEKNPTLSSMISTGNAPIFYLSLYRMYFDQFNAPQGVVEVIQYCDNIFGSLNELEDSNSLGESFYVFNSAGQQVYPYTQSGGDGKYYYNCCHSQPKESLSVKDPTTGRRSLVASQTSDFTGWTTIVVSDENIILSSFKTFTFYVFIVSAFILLTALLFSFYAAKTFTKPIKTLSHNMRTIVSHDQLEDIPDLNSGLVELEGLNESFRHMNRKIKSSLDELLLAQKNEMDSKMLALQSQMNPHFLYNSLSTISAMAEESMDDEIIKMCENMCDILRYISSDKSKLVPLSAEIDYTLRYVECIKLRFGDRIRYSVDIDEGMQSIMIPKLILQPLVENAIKNVSKHDKFISIVIKGVISNGLWRVTVKDNGEGFSEEAKKTIRGKIQEIESGKLLPSLEIEGMGLINIYIRLRLLYKDKTIFDIKSCDRETQGAIVEVGGSVDHINST